jgi:multicomponent Na+:H+ antiporter subunit A
MLLAIISGFALALVAPWIQRAAPRNAGWILAALPIAFTGHFVGVLRDAAAGDVAVERFRWLPALGIELAFSGDGLGALFATAISGVGAIILVYSGGYLQGHPRQGRFYAYILAFMASMLGVALADDLIGLFVFWELTSISSYLLIGFECDKKGSSESAQQALIVTAGGGLALLAGFVVLGQAGGSFTISELTSRGEELRSHGSYLAILLLVAAGAFTKSAQFPFHFWLPNAMVAPTPVSAYLHSATMVKAGIYLLARLSPILGGTEAWRWLLTITGGITMLLGATFALSQRDLKRQLAYATLSVLGTLTLLIGHGTAAAIGAAIVMFVAHAGYKGALFLVVGSIDHAVGTRDVAKLSGLARRMPITAVAGVAAALSMAGLPPFLGFLSKETSYESFEPVAIGTIFLGALVVTKLLLVTVAAMTGLRPFFGEPRDDEGHEVPPSMWLGPLLLAAFGLGGGLGAGALSGVLTAAARAVNAEAEIDLALYHGWTLSFILGLVTLAAGFGLFLARRRVVSLLSPLRVIAHWGPERAYEIDDLTVNLVARASTGLLQHGYLRHYVGVIIVTTVGLASVALFRDGIPLLAVATPDIRFHEAAVAVTVLFAAAATASVDSRIAAVAALGAVGYGVALFFVLLGAPDLALTQFSIETLTVLLFLVVVYRLPPYVKRANRISRARDALVAGAAGVLMTLLVLAVTAVPEDSQVSHWFADHSLSLANGRNVVNVILVDFRALDTLGEITVLAVAAIGVFALMKLRLGAERSE